MVQKIRHRACASVALFRGGAAAQMAALTLLSLLSSPRPSHCPVKSFKSASEREREGGGRRRRLG